MNEKHGQRLALFIADLGGGGAERVFVNLARTIAARGIAVDLVVGNLKSSPYLDDVPASVNIVDLNVRRMALGVPSLVKYLRREKPDALLATRMHSNCIAVLAAKFAGYRLRVAVRESGVASRSLEPFKFPRKTILSRFMRYCYPRADKVIAVSARVADDLVENLSVPRSKIEVIYSPLIATDLQKKSREPVDHPWFASGQPPVVLTVGRLSEEKNHNSLIRAFARVRERIAARLLILGEGERRPALESLAAELGLDADVSLPGFDPNPFSFMAKARVFVLSSAWEGMPGALAQALACGCPAIATDCPGGSRELLQDGRLGTLVPVNDEVALGDAIAQSLRGARESKATIEDLKPFTEEEATGAYLGMLLPPK
ncbi:MAG: glycosyltransferase [Candidatus Nealsonbacteria bacterium]|nr:glycosyltransferase [Candidatus Nealsonbacteria bacterium]